MRNYISDLVNIIKSREAEELPPLIDDIFRSIASPTDPASQKDYCTFILHCSIYECHRLSLINQSGARMILSKINTPANRLSTYSKELFTEQISYLYEQSAPRCKPCSKSDTTEIIDTLVHNDCASISLQNIADRYGMSVPNFSIIFKKQFGENFKDYVREKKIECAKEMLLTSRESITDISKYLGYSSPDYFTQVFKSSVGITPSQYRTVNSLP